MQCSAVWHVFGNSQSYCSATSSKLFRDHKPGLPPFEYARMQPSRAKMATESTAVPRPGVLHTPWFIQTSISIRISITYSSALIRRRFRIDLGSPLIPSRPSSRRGWNPINLAHKLAGWLAQLTGSTFNQLSQYANSPGNRAYCHAELVVFFPSGSHNHR